MIGLLLFFIFITISLLAYNILSLFCCKAKVISRLEKFFNPHVKEHKNKVKPDMQIHMRKALNTAGDRMGRVRPIKKYIVRIQDELIEADLLLRGEEFIAFQCLIAAFVTLCTLYITESIFIGLAVGMIGWVVPRMVVSIRKNKRHKLFSDQLGDAVVLISNSLKAGHSFLQAITSVVDEMPKPISREFEKVLKEMRLGVSTEKALENLLLRIKSDDLELMVTAVIIQRQVGGNLSQILDNLSDTIRERVKLSGEIKTLTAQGKLSGLIISLLPIVLGILLFIINPSYVSELFKSTIGIMIVAVATVNEIVGMLFIKKIVNIEV